MKMIVARSAAIDCEIFINSFFYRTPPGGSFWVPKNMIIKYVEIEII